ncbi:MAG: Hsp20/alpha crystallin family protein [Candidatus Andersenbacteria bacterium]
MQDTNITSTEMNTDTSITAQVPQTDAALTDAQVPVTQTQESEEEEGQLTIDVYQTPDDVVVLSTIAGVKSADLEITLNNDLLTIRGSRTNPAEAKQEDYFYQENYWGTFSRSVILPVDVDGDKVRAELKDGVLKVLLPKATKAKTKRIKVSSAR